MNSAAAFLFNLFIEEPRLTRANSEEIRKTLGPFPASAATKVSTIVKSILTCLPSNSSLTRSSQEASSSSIEKHEMKKEFGHNISFKYDVEAPMVSSDGDYVKSKHQTGYDSLSEDESSEASNSGTNLFTQTILDGMKQSINKPVEKKKTASKMSVPEASPVQVLPYSGEWLKAKCKAVVREGNALLSWHELYLAIFEPLSSGQENAAIENDVSVTVHLSACVYMNTHRGHVIYVTVLTPLCLKLLLMLL